MDELEVPNLGATLLPRRVSAAQLRQWRQGAIAQAPHLGALEVDWLLAELAEVEPRELHLAAAEQVFELPCNLESLEQLWQQRWQQQVPLQYLVGHTPWRRFRLAVSPAVLVPRPETELIVEIAQAIALTQGLNSGHWADLGTGSGAIALGLADLLPAITVHGVDCSAAALAIAQQNAIAQTRSQSKDPRAAERIIFHQGHWFEPLTPWQGQLRAMVSNPPYIPTGMLAELQPEVRLHEPVLALDGGPTGLDCLSHLVKAAPSYLQPGGLWLVELMAGQAPAVAALLAADGRYGGIEIHRDLSGIERFVSALVNVLCCP